MRSKRTFESDDEESKTRKAILRSAERLFATRGIEATTMREITADAGTNLAAVNYHFGSKQELAYALFERLAAEVCAGRHAELDEIERDAGGKPASVEAIVRVFLRPYVEGDEGRRLLLVRLIQQHRLEPTAVTRRVSAAHFDPLAARTTKMLCRGLPQLPARDVFWRYHLMVGAVMASAFDVAPGNRLSRISRGAADSARRAELIEQTVAFLVNAMQGEPTPASGELDKPGKSNVKAFKRR
ncbi:MAG: TetR family transcriptional regulator [Xanthobacteraceae bacterium]|nr:TetR family transcriptional regulator [Xanthobacteraceae bacterium]